MQKWRKISLWKNITANQWQDWHWQLKNVITTLKDLEQVIDLSNKEKQGIKKAIKHFKFRLSPHMALLMDKKVKKDPFKKQFIPSGKEVTSLDENHLFSDVNADLRFSPVKGLIHRYPTKVLILPTDYCGTYCRYCFRRKFVSTQEKSLQEKDYLKMFDYVKKHPKIEEVILSGGDPLVQDNKTIDYLLSNFKKISHVKILRIHTRLPVTIPFRITNSLIKILKKHLPVYVVVHIDTAKELSKETKQAFSSLVDNGIPVLASCPLLKGINDDEKTLKTLWTELVKLRVKPYYLFHSDPVKGLKHFLVPLTRGIEIMRNLYDNMSGLAMPQYCFNIPDGGGHVLISPNSIKKLKKGKYQITNFEGKKFIYQDIAEK